MSRLKDKERFFLILKIFLHLNGPATAKEICTYLKNCPVKLQKEFTPIKIGVLLRGQEWVKKERKGEGKSYTYWVKV